MDLGFLTGIVIACSVIIILVLIIGLRYIAAKQKVILGRLGGNEKPVDKRPVSFETQAVEAQPAVNLSAEVPAAEVDNEEVIAVISAAVAAVLGKSSSQVRIKSIRRSGQLDHSWVMSGRRDLMDSRY